MYKNLIPNYYYDDIYKVEYNMLKENGIVGLIFDLDNTIATYKTKVPTKKMVEFINSLKYDQFLVTIVSNNSADRVKKFTDGMGINIVPSAKKPLLSGINRAISQMNLPKEKIAIVGDQIYTDVWGGNRAGITTVLVDPIEIKETFFFKLKRALEAPILKRTAKTKGKN